MTIISMGTCPDDGPGASPTSRSAASTVVIAPQPAGCRASRCSDLQPNCNHRHHPQSLQLAVLDSWPCSGCATGRARSAGPPAARDPSIRLSAGIGLMTIQIPVCGRGSCVSDQHGRPAIRQPAGVEEGARLQDWLLRPESAWHLIWIRRHPAASWASRVGSAVAMRDGGVFILGVPRGHLGSHPDRTPGEHGIPGFSGPASVQAECLAGVNP